MGKLGAHQCRSGRVWKISPGPECDPRTAQPVSSRFTERAVTVHLARVEERIVGPPPGIELRFLGYVACSEMRIMTPLHSACREKLIFIQSIEISSVLRLPKVRLLLSRQLADGGADACV
jgi:hypothetical protein